MQKWLFVRLYLFVAVFSVGVEAAEITTFTVTPNVVAIGETLTTNSTTVGTASSCRLYINGANTAAIYVNRTGTRSAPGIAGEYIYELVCGELRSEPQLVTVVNPTAIIDSFTVSPAIIHQGDSATLTWQSRNAASCTLNGAGVAATGSKSLAATDVQNIQQYTYELICENSSNQVSKIVTLDVLPTEEPTQPNPIVIFSFSPTVPQIVLGSSVQLQWHVENADACILVNEGNVLHSGLALVGTQSVTPSSVGDKTYELVCSQGENESRASLSVKVNEADIEPPVVAEISSFSVTPSVVTVGGSLTTKSVTVNTANSCRLYINGVNTAAIFVNRTGTRSAPGNAGEYIYELVCGELRSAPQQVIVVDPAIIENFSVSPTSIPQGSSATLSWSSRNTTSCLINNEIVATTGSKVLMAEEVSDVQRYTYNLSCSGPANNAIGNTSLEVVAPPSSTSLSGKYFGEYTKIMAQGDAGVFAYIGLGAKIDGSGNRYKIMGWNANPAYWMWDFDALNETGVGKIYLGGAYLQALNAMITPFRLFSPERDRRVGQELPDVNPPLSDAIGTFTVRNDGTYAVNFNLQIFLSIAGYPLGKLNNLMRVTENIDGTLQIVNLDTHPDGITYFDGWDGSVSANGDGIPGVLLPRAGEINPITNQPAINGVFPERVSPSYHSAKPLVKINFAADCNGDGIPDEVARQLRLDPCVADNDGDGIADVDEIGPNWAMPLETDRDAIPDVLKPTQFSGNPKFAGQIVLGNGERVVLYSDVALNSGSFSPFYKAISPEWFGNSHPFFSYTSDFGQRLPTVDAASGKLFNFELGSLVFKTRQELAAAKVRMYFANGVPDGLTLFLLDEKQQLSGVTHFSRTSEYYVHPYTVLADGKTIEFQGPHSSIASVALAFAHTADGPRIVAPFDTSDPIYQEILTEAVGQEEPEPEPDPILINSFVPSAATITLGNSVQLLWQAQNAGTCSLSEGSSFLSMILPTAGSYEFTPSHTGNYSFELVCISGANSVSATTSVFVQDAGGPIDPNAITGVWHGHYNLTMRTAPEGVVLGFSTTAPNWTWNFDEGWAQFGDYDPALPGQGLLSVGFPFHVQDVGNVDPVGDRAFFTNNGDGTYTLYHGYQINNPFVGNPRTEVFTVFHITRNGDQLEIVTVDSDNDGVPGVQVPGVFPLTVSPDFVGSASQNGGSGNSSSSSSSVSSSVPSSSSSAQSSVVVVPGSSASSSVSSSASSAVSSSVASSQQGNVIISSSSVANSSVSSSAVSSVQSSSLSSVASSSSSVVSSSVASSSAISSSAVSSSSSSANSGVITGVWKGNFDLTMRAFIAQGQGTVLGTSLTSPEWTWNFDEGWAEFGQGMLSVGFPFHVQDIGNASSSHDRAYFTNNGNGTYTLAHGFQIYNPNVGNPRTETATTFRITRSGNQLNIITLDADNDGVPGTQIIGVFPLTVEPDFIGSATLVQGTNSSSSSQQSSQSSSQATAAIVRGRVAVGAPVVNASVVARCSDGSGFTFPVTTDSSGSYAGLIENTASLPCALQASGGQPAVVLHSYATAPGTVNITPLTDLILAVASGQLPSEWFASSNWQSVGSSLAGAQSQLAQQLAQGNYTLNTANFAPFTTDFVIGDAHDQLLDQLQDAIAADSNITSYSDLLTKVKTGGSLAIIPVATNGSSSSASQSSVASSSHSSVASSSASSSSAGGGSITGVWQGTFSLTMRAAPGNIVLGDSHNIAWTWNFNEGWAEFGQGMLSVGFPFHVQDIGNAAEDHDRAALVDNGDGTYTLLHGFQIYNPSVGNPRTETSTTFRIARNGDQLEIVTLDVEANGVPDGILGTQIVGVFPLTVEPDFIGTATQVEQGSSSSSSAVQSSSSSVANSSSSSTGQASSVSSSSSSVGQSSSSSSAPVDTGPGTAGLTGIYRGEHMITMRGCPGVCVAGQEVVLGTGVKNSPWVWDFDNRTVVITGTTLTVGFNYEVQAIGNMGEGDERLIADFTDNGDGTYTLYHGFQIYNPNVGNPRTDTTTLFRITQDASNPNLLQIVTLDGETDGIPGTQVIGVFPMTVQPEFRGSARREGSSSAGDGISDQVKESLGLNPDAPGGDTDGDGIPDVTEIGPDPAHPLDSDGDGIIDALEPGDAAWDATRIGRIALLDGIPGRTQEGFPNSGTSVNVGLQGDWLFIGADTGLLQLTATGDNAGAIPDTSLGDAGLDYRYGYVQLYLRAGQLQPASSSSTKMNKTSFSAVAALAEPVATPVTLTLTYEAALPAANKLLVYATALVDGKERYTLMDKADYRRVDDHTLEVTVKDNGSRDLDSANGVLRIGVAPTTNTLGGHDQSSGNASNDKRSGGGSISLLMLLGLGVLSVVARRPTTYRKAA